MQKLEVFARVLKVLGDPTRVQMLDLPVQRTGSLCECDLIPLFSQHQPTISHHLQVLRGAGLVATEEQGIWVHVWATEQGRAVLSAARVLSTTE